MRIKGIKGDTKYINNKHMKKPSYFATFDDLMFKRSKLIEHVYLHKSTNRHNIQNNCKIQKVKIQFKSSYISREHPPTKLSVKTNVILRPLIKVLPKILIILRKDAYRIVCQVVLSNLHFLCRNQVLLSIFYEFMFNFLFFLKDSSFFSKYSQNMFCS